MVSNKLLVTRRALASIAAIGLSATLIGCGGSTPEGYTEESSAPAETQQRGSVQSARSYINSDLSSTPPGNRSGDFNPSIWNEHNWYECDCARRASPPQATPWR